MPTPGTRPVVMRSGTFRRGLGYYQKYEVNKIVNKKMRKVGEPHHYDKVATPTVVSGGTITSLSDMAVGDTDITRTGDRIDPRSLTVKFTMRGNTNARNSYRVVLLRWHPDDASEAPTLAGIFESTTYLDISPYNWDDRSKFTILHDTRGQASDDKSSKDFLRNWTAKIYGKKLKKIQYDNTATSGVNNLYIVMWANEATNGPVISYYSRLAFKDS